MKTETILSRKDGSRVKLTCTFNYNHSGYNYKIQVDTCGPRKRAFKRIDVSDDYQYRQLPFNGPERAQFELEAILEHVTQVEINAAKLKTWENLKPSLI